MASMRFARYLRQMRLADVGEAGQARLAASRTNVELSGVAARIAGRYLAGAGVGTLGVDAALAGEIGAVNRDIVLDAGTYQGPAANKDERLADLDPAARELAEGAMFALRELRRILLVERDRDREKASA